MGGAVAQPTYNRQRFLLAFIRQIEGTVSATDLQKLVFLYSMEEGLDHYEFVPYKFGPYSFQLKEDIDILGRDGFVNIRQVQDATRIKAAGAYSKGDMYRIAKERGDALIRKAYREYPYYALNSEIAGRLFRDEELEQFARERRSYAQDEQVLFTIGYEGRTIESFVNAQIKNDVKLLCDVRKNPLSRKFGFSKGKLEHITQTVGIKYAHIPGLGIEPEKRCSLETPEDYRRLFAGYAKTLPARKAYLEEVYSLLQADTRVALMCFEHDPEMCHRHVVRDALVAAHQLKSVDL